MYFIGTDLGQRRDPSAIAIAERREQILHGFDHLHWLPTAEKLPAEWIVRRLERIPLGTPYTNVVDRLAVIANHPQIRGNAWLVLDATGVGAPVVDMVRARNLPVHLMPVVLTAGAAENFDGRTWHVPKVDLFARLQMLLEQRLLRIAKGTRDSGTLIRELIDVRTRPTRRGNIRIGADACHQHDDLVMAVALAVWSGRRREMQQNGRVGPVPHRVL